MLLSHRSGGCVSLWVASRNPTRRVVCGPRKYLSIGEATVEDLLS
jgi:hypothetical protein